jgi:pyridoxamine 5'-phosphate oxidase
MTGESNSGKKVAMTALDPFSEDATDPLALFRAWLDEAKETEPNDPNAMSLATVSLEGKPSVRIVLLKALDDRGFIFYTNRDGRKGRELDETKVAALCFHWKSKLRQVRVEGVVGEVTAEEADAYFHSRARISQIGAWASQQSRPLDSRATLENSTAAFEEKFPGEVPRPPYWTGFIVAPESIEFWQDRPYRLHDRVVFTKAGEHWAKQRLYP